jgi:hypothetical protein
MTYSRAEMRQVHDWFLSRGLPLVLNVLHRRGTTASENGRRTAALPVMALFVVVLPVTASGWSGAALAEAPAFLLVSLLAIWFTYLGFGSVLL